MSCRLPGATGLLAGFAPLLRSQGFAVSPLQTIDFLAAVGVLGPKDYSALRCAAHACFAPAIERRSDFDALMDAYFCGTVLPTVAPTPDTDVLVPDEKSGNPTGPSGKSPDQSGEAACVEETLTARTFASHESDIPSVAEAVSRLPRRRVFRMRGARRGRIDLRRSLARIVACDGDVPNPVFRARHQRQRRLLVLIDVSGSMKAFTADYIKFVHLLSVHGADPEAFTLGTRLTRITDALRNREFSGASQLVADAVLDWDGGTRLGASLGEFVENPRMLQLARGAVVLILSDGLERGDPEGLVRCVRRLARISYRLVWATPLAADPRFRPATRALSLMLPVIDLLADGSGLPALAALLGQLGTVERARCRQEAA